MTKMKVLVFVTCAAILLSATEVTIRVPLSSEVTDIVTFDPNRVSAADVKRWILLSKDGPYSGAETSPSKQLAELNAQKYPPELAEVASYFKRLQCFLLWHDNQLQKFKETGNVSALEQEFEGIDPKQGCALALDHIRAAGNRKKAEHIAEYEWGNCVAGLRDKQADAYPEQAWNSFLRNYGIREQLWSEED